MNRDGMHDGGGERLPFACGVARRRIGERLDGVLDDDARAELALHLAACAACRAADAEMSALVEGLRELPELTLPDADLAAVWARTIDAPAASKRRPLDGRIAMVAAALLVGAALLAPVFREGGMLGPRREFTDAELARAAADVQLVFKLTNHAMKKSERTAVDQALGRGLGPALRRIPLLDEGLTGSTTRRD